MRSRIVRILRTSLIVLLLTLVTGVVVVVALSERQLRRRHAVGASTVAARTDSIGVTRGEHLFHSISCAECHAADGGGAVYSDMGPIGVIAGPNLTRGRGGVGASRSDADWVNAVRHGVKPDGTSLMVMPSEVFTYLTDEDLGAILGYLRQLPPVDREVPPSHFRWLGRTLLAAGRLDILVAPKTPASVPRSVVPEGPTAEYGGYLARIAGCHGCHGEGMSGGIVAGPPGLPAAANLTPTGLAGWTEADFVTVMRTGRRPDGYVLHQFMPWRAFRHMTDDELVALWRYLQGLPAKPFGGK